MDNYQLTNLLPKPLVNSQKYFVVVINLQGKYVYINETFKNKYAFLKDNITRFSFHDNIHPDDIEKCHTAAKTCIANPDDVVPVCVRRLTNTPKVFFWIDWELSLLQDDNKQPLGILCIGQDISKVEKANEEAKKIFRKAQALSKKINTIVENINDGFYMLNRQWKIIKVNQTALNMAGMHKEQLLHKNFWEMFPPSTSNSNYHSLLHRAMEEHNIVAFDNYSTRFNKWFHIICLSFHARAKHLF